MEAIPTLRCLPRKSALCCFLICTMLLLCAFYNSHYTDSAVSELKLSDINDFDKGTQSRYSESGNTLQMREIAESAIQNKLFGAVRNITSRMSAKISNSVQQSTKKSQSSSSTPASSKSVHDVTVKSSSANTCSLKKENSKLILLWTPFFDYWNYLPQLNFDQCTRCRNCVITTNKTKLLESDAVIFHARDMDVTHLPPFRLPNQRWVFYCLESPPYSDFPGLQYTQHMFNWTMTYRSDSDIPAPYGYVSKVHPSRQLDLQNLEWAWSNKSRSVVWMSSHCPTHGGRDLFAKELGRYIDVDVYGTCGTSICPPGQTEKCIEEFAQKYKFFLAFENTLCKDYITEKFFRTLKYNIIPVVFGGANYERFAPSGSFIDALSFKSPKHLAFFLTGVGKSFKLYSSFFKWRRNYVVNLGNRKECQLCSMLHNKSLKSSTYTNLRDWWIRSSDCKTWEPKR